jgi:hypothetical protein
MPKTIIPRASVHLELPQIDITQPDDVVVELDMKRGVLYVHVNGVTALRICRLNRETTSVLVVDKTTVRMVNEPGE